MGLRGRVPIQHLLLLLALIVQLNDMGELVILIDDAAVHDTEPMLIPGVGNFFTHLKMEIPPAGAALSIRVELQLLGGDPG